MTMPNILRQFSPNLTGFSLGETWLYTKKGENLNRAISGSQAFNLLEQVKSLIEMMRNSSVIDFKEDWKIVTMFIGANDLCESCKGSEHNFPSNYIGYIREALGKF